MGGYGHSTALVGERVCLFACLAAALLQATGGIGYGDWTTVLVGMCYHVCL
jgi:hypothetical protein